jgi:hypothetical protein
MSIAAKLYIEDKEHNVLYLRISAKQEVDEHGMPRSGFIGGYFDIEIESTKDSTILQWAIDHDTKKDVNCNPFPFWYSQQQDYRIKGGLLYCSKRIVYKHYTQSYDHEL